MLSQLASGQRVKISNPAVYGRLLRLGELASTEPVRSGDPDTLRTALDDVAASQPSLTTEHAVSRPQAADPAAVSVAYLAGTASPGELLRAAAAVPGSALAGLLDAAARTAAGTPDQQVAR